MLQYKIIDKALLLALVTFVTWDKMWGDGVLWTQGQAFAILHMMEQPQDNSL